MMRRRILTLFIILLVTAPVFRAGAQNNTLKFGFKDFFRIKKVYSPRLSPDGKFTVFEVSEADTGRNRWVSHLWRTTVSGGETVRMTRGEKGERHARWSPDGNTIYFLADNEGHDNIFRMDNRGGEAVLLFSHPADIPDFKIAADGSKIYFLAEDSLSAQEKADQEENNDAYVVDESLQPSQVWVYNLRTHRREKLTDGDYSVREFILSPAEKKIAFVAAPSPRENDYLKREIYTLDLDSRTQEKLTDNGIAEKRLRWSPDGAYILFISDSNSLLETYYQDSIFLLNIATRNVVDLLPDFDEQAFEYFITKNGRYIYFTANTGVNTQIFRLDRRKGGIRQLTTADHEVRYLHYQPEANRMVYAESTPDRPFDVFYAAPDNLPGRKLTAMNGWFDVYPKAEYRTVRWESPDGYTAEGILILPPGNAGQPYPLVLQLHGGPESSYRNYFRASWATYAQIWTSRGYAVFQPNYRGSTGYGDDVMRAIIGHYFEKDIDDIISGVDYLIDRGIADPQKLAVMGWSAGGHLTNWLVTHFQRFKVASSGAGGANWFSFYAQTDVQYIREIWHMGPPYTRADYYREKSPVNYVENAGTPTLILCGKEDRRVPFPQSLEMYRGLNRMGCPVKFVAFPREGHGLRELKHQLYKMRVEFQWVEKHLFNRDWDLEELN